MSEQPQVRLGAVSVRAGEGPAVLGAAWQGLIQSRGSGVPREGVGTFFRVGSAGARPHPTTRENQAERAWLQDRRELKKNGQTAGLTDQRRRKGQMAQEQAWLSDVSGPTSQPRTEDTFSRSTRLSG